MRAPQDHAETFCYSASSSLEIQARAPQSIPEDGIVGDSFYNNTQPITEDSTDKPSVKRLQYSQGRDSKATYNLGVAYHKGNGVPQDCAKAMECSLKAANQGHASTQNYAGEKYHEGHGVPQDYSKATEWFLKSANQRYAVA